MKRKISIVTVSLLLTSTIATASPNKQMNFMTLNKNDSQILFGDTSNNIVTLEQKEMMETEGKWITYALGAFAGALGGGYSYQASYANSNSWSWGGLFASMGGGALAGVASPVSSVGEAITAIGFGAAGGYIQNGGWR